jgi:hypothetical protein
MEHEEEDKRKFSTLNSMFITSTIGKPCTDSIIQAVATILHSQMLEVSLFFEFLTMIYAVGSKLKQNYSPGQRSIFLQRGEIHPRKTRSIR